MWIWHQRDGQMRSAMGDFLASGYSGHGIGRNEPSAQHLHDTGPIPVGAYQLGFAMDHPTKGPMCIPLIPFAANQMFGRSGFLIHGDNAQHDASQGCIILPPHARQTLANGTDRLLVVLP